MKFLADIMGVSQATVAWLRKGGFEAAHLREQGLQRLPDEGIVRKARDEGRESLERGAIISVGEEKHRVRALPI